MRSPDSDGPANWTLSEAGNPLTAGRPVVSLPGCGVYQLDRCEQLADLSLPNHALQHLPVHSQEGLALPTHRS